MIEKHDTEQSVMAERLAGIDEEREKLFLEIKDAYLTEGVESLLAAGSKMMEALDEQVAGTVLAYLVESRREEPSATIVAQLKEQARNQHERLSVLGQVLDELKAE